MNDAAFPADFTRVPNLSGNDQMQRGLTKREYFAAHIMAMETAHDNGERHLAKIAEHAVKAADYLLVELAK